MKIETSQTLFVVTLEVESRLSEEVAQTVRTFLQAEPVERMRPGATHVWLEVYLADDVEARIAASVCKALEGVVEASVQPCEEQDWTTFWRHHFKPHAVGKQFWICPDWEREQPVPAGKTALYINPAMSFGTGEHFTTRFCLEQLEQLCDMAAPLSLLDVGTGSGLLAIAAAKLGYAPVVGLDHDEQAIESAGTNAAMNGVAERIVYRVDEVTEAVVSETYDIVCANLFADLLIDTAAYLARSARRYVVVSGIKDMQTEAVAEAFLGIGCKQVTCDGDGEWSGLVFEVGT